MRIISGKYKGRKLNSPEDNRVRPTSDKVKESMFDVLQFRLQGTRVLDLFAGAGSLGIEAISRGAYAEFCDCDRDSLALLRSNLQSLGISATVYGCDYRQALSRVSDPCDIIFLDPPYALDVLDTVCSTVRARNLLVEDGVIVYEYDTAREWDVPDGFYVTKCKQYGKTGVAYLSRAVRECAVTGSFDPITIGHMSVIESALEAYDRVHVVIAQNEQKESCFDLDTRAQIVRLALKDERNVTVEVCRGMVWEHCRDHGVRTIVRGYRNERDLAYEQNMAEFNAKYGLYTELIEQSQDALADISSTAVRQALEQNTSLRGLVPREVEKTIRKLYGGNNK